MSAARARFGVGRLFVWRILHEERYIFCRCRDGFTQWLGRLDQVSLSRFRRIDLFGDLSDGAAGLCKEGRGLVVATALCQPFGRRCQQSSPGHIRKITRSFPDQIATLRRLRPLRSCGFKVKDFHIDQPIFPSPPELPPPEDWRGSRSTSLPDPIATLLANNQSRIRNIGAGFRFLPGEFKLIPGIRCFDRRPQLPLFTKASSICSAGRLSQETASARLNSIQGRRLSCSQA